MSFTVVFIVSPSVQSIPNAVRAQGQSSPLIALIALLTRPQHVHLHPQTGSLVNHDCKRHQVQNFVRVLTQTFLHLDKTRDGLHVVHRFYSLSDVTKGLIC